MNRDFLESFVVKETARGHERSPEAGSLVRKYKITIGGESYFLVSDEPEERVHAVARLVDQQMKAIAEAGHSDDPKRVAVLVALQCASKMLASAELLEHYQAHNELLLSSVTEELSRYTTQNPKQ